MHYRFLLLIISPRTHHIERVGTVEQEESAVSDRDRCRKEVTLTLMDSLLASDGCELLVQVLTCTIVLVSFPSPLCEG
jgi:hypothetical protein